MARELPLVVTAPVGERLHVACRHFNGHATSVMAGGLVSEAKWQSKTKCRFGHMDLCPNSDHLLWHCHTFSHLRMIRKPSCPLTARLGWGPRGIGACLQQMAAIRVAASTLRLRLEQTPPGEGEMGGAGGQHAAAIACYGAVSTLHGPQLQARDRTVPRRTRTASPRSPLDHAGP